MLKYFFGSFMFNSQ